MQYIRGYIEITNITGCSAIMFNPLIEAVTTFKKMFINIFNLYIMIMTIYINTLLCLAGSKKSKRKRFQRRCEQSMCFFSLSFAICTIFYLLFRIFIYHCFIQFLEIWHILQNKIIILWFNITSLKAFSYINSKECTY